MRRRRHDVDSLQPDGGFTSTTIVGAVIDFSSFPTAKKSAMASPSCSVGNPPASYQVCSYDYCCAPTSDGGTTGTCQKWIDPASASCTRAPGVDFELGVGCVDNAGVVHMPVCNRGTVDATSGILLVAGYPGNPASVGTSAICANPSTNNPPEGCTINLAQRAIPAGKCIDLPVSKAAQNQVPGMKCNSTADFGNGNRTSMINPPSTNFGNLPKLSAGNYTQLPEGNACNNYSFVYTQFGSCAIYGQQPPPPAAVTYEYTATCAPGYHVVWNQLAYDTTAPFASEIVFQASTATKQLDGGLSAFSTPVTVADIGVLGDGGTGDPAVCTMAGTPAGCPKSVANALGTAKNGEVLRLGITMIATSAIPTVNGWQVTYSCIPAE